MELLAKAKRNNHLTGKYIDEKYLLDIVWTRFKREEGHRFPFQESDYIFCEKSIKKVLESSFNPLLLNIIDIEKQFRIPIDREGFKYEFYDILSKPTKITKGQYEIRGTVDLVTEIDKDTIEIIDWKTGKRTDWATGKLKDYEYLSKKDIQLRLYDVAIQLLYPQYKYRLLTINFINDGGPFTVSFSDEDREETYDILKNKINNISTNPVPTRIKEVNPDNKWKCTKVCPHGKNLGPNGMSWCDNIYYYMVNNSVDETIVKIDEIKKKRTSAKPDKENKVNNRRNKEIEQTKV